MDFTGLSVFGVLLWEFVTENRWVLPLSYAELCTSFAEMA